MDLTSNSPDWNQLLDMHPVVVLDLGANNLSATLTFAKLFQDAYIHAFEADPRAYNNGRINLSKIGESSRKIFFHNSAVGGTDGIRWFYPSSGIHPSHQWYDTGYDLFGSLLKPAFTTHPEFSTVFFDAPIQVQCVTLDSWVKTYRPRKIDLIQMDIQGGELDVIKGGATAMKMAKWLFFPSRDSSLYLDHYSLEDLIKCLPDHTLCSSNDVHSGSLFRRNY